MFPKPGIIGHWEFSSAVPYMSKKTNSLKRVYYKSSDFPSLHTPYNALCLFLIARRLLLMVR
jgi:hypothetical protein